MLRTVDVGLYYITTDRISKMQRTTIFLFLSMLTQIFLNLVETQLGTATVQNYLVEIYNAIFQN